MSSANIDWNDVIKKEARGTNDEDLGEVQEVKDNYVLVQRGIIDKEKFYIPKDQAESFDGDVLKFKFSEQELSKYQDEQSSYLIDAESNSDINHDNIQEDTRTTNVYHQRRKDWMFLRFLKKIKQQLLKNLLQKLKQNRFN